MKTPLEYTPYATINFCNNQLIDTQFLILKDSFYPILVGRGISPRVWLYYQGGNGEFNAIIKNNISFNPLIKVVVNEESRILSVRLLDEDLLILEINFQNPESPTIEAIDLSPIGLNIIGDRGALKVGNMTVSGNTIENSEAFIVIKD